MFFEHTKTSKTPAYTRYNITFHDTKYNTYNTCIRLNFAGNPELNLPSLDPVYIPKLSIYRDLQDIKVIGELYNLTAKGASSISTKSLKCVIILINH